jgi:hypothetical protein
VGHPIYLPSGVGHPIHFLARVGCPIHFLSRMGCPIHFTYGSCYGLSKHTNSPGSYHDPSSWSNDSDHFKWIFYSIPATVR